MNGRGLDMTEPPLDDEEIQQALTEYYDGMRLRDGVRASKGMRLLKAIDGANLELLIQMFGHDPKLGFQCLYFLDFGQPLGTAEFCEPHWKLNSSLLAAFVAGDAEKVSVVLAEMGKIEGDDLKLLAKFIEEAGENNCLRFVQRRTGPAVDPLAVKARWFALYNQFRKIPTYKEDGEKKLRKQLIGEAADYFMISRSLLYSVLRYFHHPKD